MGNSDVKDALISVTLAFAAEVFVLLGGLVCCGIAPVDSAELSVVHAD